LRRGDGDTEGKRLCGPVPLCYDAATVSKEPEIQGLLERMRREWDQRAAEDAKYYVYTRDRDFEERDFEESGRINYDQLVRPSLPIFLNGRSPKSCRVVEIGCGLGRMTRWFAEQFLEVHGVDISAEMIAEARRRLRDYPNVVLHVGSGQDLSFLLDEYFDLAFSYIVFQHIPSRAIIENYLRETARVLKPGAVFKFQLNGRRESRGAEQEQDTWHGESFTLSEAARMAEAAGLAPIFADGIGTQYFLLAARKQRQPSGAPLSCIFPAQPGTEGQLLEGWLPEGETSSRAVAARSRTLLAVPEWHRLQSVPRDANTEVCATRLVFYLAICFQPLEPFPLFTIAASVNGTPIGAGTVGRKGDHYFEWPVPSEAVNGGQALVAIEINPPYEAAQAPAVRALGIYTLRG
jgi:SAM-dependent methyltransferase